MSADLRRPDHRRFRGAASQMTVDGRFWAKVTGSSHDECWEWQAARDKDGYGFFWTGTKQVRAHTWIYERMRADIPAGLQIDHTCHNPPCVNPWHLDVVSQLENIRRRRPELVRAAARRRALARQHRKSA